MIALVFARLALREAARRRLLVALVGLTVAVILLTGWGFSRIPTLSDRSGPIGAVQVRLIASQLLILVLFMFSFVVALSAVFVASPALSGELESGVALVLLARPIDRRAYVLGKWLGLAALITGYVVAGTLAELAVVQAVTGYAPPEPAQLVAYLTAEGLVCLTLALALSTRLSGMVGGVVALVVFGLAWLGGIVGGLGAVFASDAISQIGVGSRLLFPADLLWRGAVWSLEPSATRVAVASAGPAALATPFFAAGPPDAGWLLWTALWAAGILALAVRSFAGREI